MKILFLILKALILIEMSLSLDNNQLSNNQFECLIGNNKYLYEYLSGSKDYFQMTDHSLIKKLTKNHRVYSLHQLTLKNSSILKWILIQKNQTHDTYYLKNKVLNEYLCASDLPDKDGRRNIHTISIRNDAIKIKMNKIHSKCIWKLDRTFSEINDFNSYTIKNVYFNESLFSAISKMTKYKRNVYLWNKNPASDKYKWVIDC